MGSTRTATPSPENSANHQQHRETVYPIMRDPNSNTLQGNAGVGLYDPYDPPNKEYRGYIGYEQGGQILLRPETRAKASS